MRPDPISVITPVKNTARIISERAQNFDSLPTRRPKVSGAAAAEADVWTGSAGSSVAGAVLWSVIARHSSAAGLISDAAHSLDDLRALRVLLHLGAQALNVDIDQPGIGLVPVAPDLL